MAGRIRTLKPEILEDDRTASLSDLEWRIFVSSMVMADDFGNLRAHPAFVHATLFWSHPTKRVEDTAAALDTLEDVGLHERYSVRGQVYAHIRNWEKHQRVDNAGKPRVPRKEDPEAWMQTKQHVYFIQQDQDGPIKIGRAANVDRRLAQLRVANPAPLHLLHSLEGDREAEFHKRFVKLRLSGEWFKPAEELLQFIRELAANSPLARAPAPARAHPRRETPTPTPIPDPIPPPRSLQDSKAISAPLASPPSLQDSTAADAPTTGVRELAFESDPDRDALRAKANADIERSKLEHPELWAATGGGKLP